MKHTHRFLALILALYVFLTLTINGKPAFAEGGAKWLKLAESFAYPSLDAHKDYYGWYTSIYGITETLFRVADDLSIEPLLAESYEVSEDGKTWTFQLAEASFSNGAPVTADMVARNFERLAELNERFAYLRDFTFTTDGERTLLIATPGVYPTMLSDLTAPEMAIMDLDGTTDFDNAPIGTGPFVVKSFESEGTVEVEKNAAYWNGEVKLDGVTFFYMQDDDSKLMAMQAGEIDGYTSVTAAAKEIFSADPDTYTVTSIPATRLQFYVLNETRLDDAVRKAINLVVDCDTIAAWRTEPIGRSARPAILKSIGKSWRRISGKSGSACSRSAFPRVSPTRHPMKSMCSRSAPAPASLPYCWQRQAIA